MTSEREEGHLLVYDSIPLLLWTLQVKRAQHLPYEGVLSVLLAIHSFAAHQETKPEQQPGEPPKSLSMRYYFQDASKIKRLERKESVPGQTVNKSLTYASMEAMRMILLSPLSISPP